MSENVSTLELSPHTNLSGQQIGHYKLKHAIGRGGMATVYRATDKRSGDEVALKVLHPQLTIEPRIVERFKRESRALLKLKHPSIVPLLDYGQDDDFLYIAMPWMQYGSLAERLMKGPISPREGARVISTVAQALHHAHEMGIIHRDIKPGNILLDGEGNALLSDFGLVMLDDSSLSLTGSLLVGTPAYMAPEQVMGENVNPASDQYSLGIVLYRMTTGLLPYEADTPIGMAVKHATQPLTQPRNVNPNIPNAIEAVLMKALSKSPLDRYASVLEFNEAFQEALLSSIDPITGKLKKDAINDEAQTVQIENDLQLDPEDKKRKRRLLFLALPLALLLMCSAGYWVSNAFWGGFALAAEPGVGSEVIPNTTRTVESILIAMAPAEGTQMDQYDLHTAVAGTLQALLEESTKSPEPLEADVSATLTGTDVSSTSGLTPDVTIVVKDTQGAAIETDTPGPLPTKSVGTNTPNPTRTPSRTATTWSPSSTPPATSTKIPTNTATNTPISDVCSMIDYQQAGSSGQEFNIRIQNNTGGNIKVSNIFISWPSSNEELKKVELAGSELWSGEDEPTDANLSGLGGNRTISSGSNKVMVLFFDDDAASGGYVLRITFNNGCTVEEDF